MTARWIFALVAVAACSSSPAAPADGRAIEAADDPRCEGAKPDAKGVCRTPDGRFAPKVCCEALACETIDNLFTECVDEGNERVDCLGAVDPGLAQMTRCCEQFQLDVCHDFHDVFDPCDDLDNAVFDCVANSERGPDIERECLEDLGGVQQAGFCCLLFDRVWGYCDAVEP